MFGSGLCIPVIATEAQFLNLAILCCKAQLSRFSSRVPTHLIILNKVCRSYWLRRSSLDSEGIKCQSKKTAELVDCEYADLNIKEIYGRGQIGHVRIRQHVNPLSLLFRVPMQAPDWDIVFDDCKLPLMVDIGTGSGRFLMWLAKRFYNSRNCVGLEIRQKLVQRSQFWVKELALRNIHFISTNATISFDDLVSSYPGPLIFVSVLCPDPHFKKRHHKRRILQKPLVDSILKNLTTGGQVYMQSDVLEVAMSMRDHFDPQADLLKHIHAIDPSFSCDVDGWLLHNPMGIRTEREVHAELQGARIYRRLYQKI
ncbi:tRNA (guanine-N(7)-)-methyltransferase [Apostasia shenzhenica]|uniref:tRNA (guanine(46)-N(7))-methyltransferase n=1 Tax=Apostasia shenzhenica TaxID=1088818 RepID=A0A2I0BBC8_9ASPA|nr:tRNA (guanine-N(7)-)-methyltransferase [Apostasia shenzhenica]